MIDRDFENSYPEPSTPAMEVTTDQFDLLMRWADTLQYYRQIGNFTQMQMQGHLALYECVIREVLHPTSLHEIKSYRWRNMPLRPEGLQGVGNVKTLLKGTISNDTFYHVLANDPIPDSRFGYGFRLQRDNEQFSHNLIVFFRGQPLLVDSTIQGIKNSIHEPTTVLDLPEHRLFKPFRLFGPNPLENLSSL